MGPGVFLSFKNVFSFFFQTRDRTACFYKAGNDPKDVTKVMMPQEREGLLLEWGPWLVEGTVWCPEEGLAQKRLETLRNAWSTCGKGSLWAWLVREIKKSGRTSTPFSYLCLCPFFTAWVSCKTLITMQIIPVHRNANEVWFLESNLLQPCGQVGFASIWKFISEFFFVILSIHL